MLGSNGRATSGGNLQGNVQDNIFRGDWVSLGQRRSVGSLNSLYVLRLSVINACTPRPVTVVTGRSTCEGESTVPQKLMVKGTASTEPVEAAIPGFGR